MAYKITDACFNCDACNNVCPVDGIWQEGNIHVLDQEICTDCGDCVRWCPVDAIVPA